MREDGNLELEGLPYLVIPHGNILLLESKDETTTLRVLQRLDGGGNLVAYEPASAIEIPPVEASSLLTLTIVDYWIGYSPLAPIEADFLLVPGDGAFVGTAEFSAGAFTEAITRTAPISVPLAVIEEVLALLGSTPAEKGTYKPLFNHTDDFPKVGIGVESGDAGLTFTSASQGKRHIPWQVFIGQDEYLTYADTPARALDLLDPYLARDVQEALFNLVMERD
jgi:hypothetical protein